MGKGNVAVNQWLQDRDRFADLFNGTLFHGRQVIRPSELEPADRESDMILVDKDRREKDVQRYRDVIMKWKRSAYLAVLACEAQSHVHYAMPVRNMVYDGMTYVEQIRLLWKEHGDGREAEVKKEEFLSKFRKGDKLYPVITLVLYYDLAEWDGSLDLYDMFYNGSLLRKNEEFCRYVPNYHVNLIDVGNVEDVSRFHTDLQVIFGMLKCRQDAEKLREYVEQHREYFESVDLEKYQALRELLHSEKILRDVRKDRKETKVNMCKALEDLYQNGVDTGREQGIEQGVERGRLQGIRALVETCRELGQTQETAGQKVAEKFSVPPEQAEEYAAAYWGKN